MAPSEASGHSSDDLEVASALQRLPSQNSQPESPASGPSNAVGSHNGQPLFGRAQLPASLTSAMFSFPGISPPAQPHQPTAQQLRAPRYESPFPQTASTISQRGIKGFNLYMGPKNKIISAHTSERPPTSGRAGRAV